MIFFFKPKTIQLDCFTTRPDVHDFYPVNYTNKFYPNWWKKMPKLITNPKNPWGSATLKACTGLNNFYSTGLTIPLWSDLFLDFLSDGNVAWQFADYTTLVNPHPPSQMEGYIDLRKYYHLKINSPWAFRCKEDVNFAWTQNTWSFDEPDNIIIPPAIIDYKYQRGVNINFFGRRTKINSNFIIKAGQPMVNIIPLSERKLKIHTHLVDNFEYSKITSVSGSFSFHSNYPLIKQLIKNKEKEKKCPLGF